MLEAGTQWPARGVPESPVGWLVHVASPRLTDRLRGDSARRRREQLAAAQEPPPGAKLDEIGAHDDSLALIFMCCHPALTPASAIALTLRAVGGLSTAEIAAAFLVPEATMAQRISRAKQTIKAAVAPGPARPLPDLQRGVPEQQRRAAGAPGPRRRGDSPHPRAEGGAPRSLIPLAEQDRSLWDRESIAEGVELIGSCWGRGAIGEYQLQAAIAAAHDQSAGYEETDWREILALYGLLERVTKNPMVGLNRAIAAAMVDGPEAGLALLEPLADPLAGHHRLRATRGHLLEMAGEGPAAIEQFERAARGTNSLPEQRYLQTQAARLRVGGQENP